MPLLFPAYEWATIHVSEKDQQTEYPAIEKIHAM